MTTINGFGILLILVERIKRDISKLENVFNEPLVEFEKHECIDMTHEGRELLNKPPSELKMNE